MTAHYVYRCYDADGRLLYVGQSKDWTVRLATHRSQAFWAGDVVHVRVAVHRSPEAARAAERVAIRNENPRFNYQGRWETRSQWTRDGWVDYVRAFAHVASCAHNQIDKICQAYVQTFGEPLHPQIEAISDALKAKAAAEREKWEREQVQWRIQREQLELADRLAMLDHCKGCPPCARVGEYADDCPELIAFDLEEQARIDAARAAS